MPFGSSNEHAAQARKVAGERASGTSVAIGDLPDNANLIKVLGVNYVHTVDEDGGDLYLTTDGYRYAEHLQPENWYEFSWFKAKRERLPGTATVYAVPTKPIRGESLKLVVKYSRVGEKVLMDTDVLENLMSCEFNGPFEEFGLVEELRHGHYGPADLQVRTQLPLAVYVPPEKIQPSQSGRFQWRIAQKVDQHPGVALDILRQHIVVYRWLPGVDAWQAHEMGLLTEAQARALNDRATSDMHDKGFKVLDMKPQHVIVEPTESGDLVREDEAIRYGVIDFELMERTDAYWEEIESAQKMTYRRRTAELLAGDGPIDRDPEPLPANLTTTNVRNVNYVHGRVESTGGLLWVVGNEPDLFEFYLPERWRTTPQIRLREDHETYFTTSKDNIPLVWKVSRVGEPPASAAFGVEGFQVLAHGFNSPFEEVAAGWWLIGRGVPTILPRAIYRTGHRSQLDESLFDPSRYKSHESFRAIDGKPVLEAHRNYITIWDEWNGPETPEAWEEASVGRSLNVAQAVERDLLDNREAADVVNAFGDRLADVGVTAMRLLPEHILLAINAESELARDAAGAPLACLCTLKYLKLPSLDTLLNPDLSED